MIGYVNFSHPCNKQIKDEHVAAILMATDTAQTCLGHVYKTCFLEAHLTEGIELETALYLNISEQGICSRDIKKYAQVFQLYAVKLDMKQRHGTGHTYPL